MNFIWDKEDLPQQWKESIVPIYKKGKTDCNNYTRIPLLLGTCKIILSRLTPYVDNIIGDN